MKIIAKPFVFARHGQSTFNEKKLIGGFTDSPLTLAGIKQSQQAEAILGRIQWKVVITSTLQRTQQTAFYAVPNQKIIPFANLKERNWGELEGYSIDQLLPYEETPPKGESWLEFESRVISTLNNILIDYDLPLIIAHSGVYRVLHNAINGTPYCSRISNITPVSFTPSDNKTGWKISSYHGESL